MQFIPVHKSLFGRYTRYAYVVELPHGGAILYGIGLHMSEAHLTTQDRHDKTSVLEWAQRVIGTPGQPLVNDGFDSYRVSYSAWLRDWRIYGEFSQEAMSLGLDSSTYTALSGGYPNKESAQKDADMLTRHGAVACFQACAQGKLWELNGVEK